MSGRHALVLLLMLCAGIGATDAHFKIHHISGPAWWLLGSRLLFSIFIFVWYHRDSMKRGFPRTALLNIGMIGLPVVAVPYYVVRSREAGHRLAGLVRLGGFVSLSLLVAWSGALVGRFVG